MMDWGRVCGKPGPSPKVAGEALLCRMHWVCVLELSVNTVFLLETIAMDYMVREKGQHRDWENPNKWGVWFRSVLSPHMLNDKNN